MTDAKGKASSMSRLAHKNDESAKSKPTIVMLKDKCCLSTGSVHTLANETKSRLHWLVHDGQHFVEKNKEGIHWDWVHRDHVPPHFLGRSC